MLKLYNTLSRKKEVFKPLKDKKAGLYTCGPTVYWFAHLGNLRTYIFEDILKRVLEFDGYKTKHVMNITDVGHLTSDADTGEDKLEKGARRERKTVWEIAEFYTKAFKRDLKFLNIREPDIWIKATDTIKEQIDLIKVLEKKGYTYKIEDGVYFDTSKLKNYGKLWGSKKTALKAGARVKMVSGKKNHTDFALWKLTPRGVKRQMEWDSPWGRGFPGWHTECVVMGKMFLGVPFDIHCGGIDHIQIHHTNEIAQAEAAFNKILANYWLHGEFLVLKEGRMGKSKGNIITVESIAKKGLKPLAYRYLVLNTHYRSQLTFSWEILKAGQSALDNLYQKLAEITSDAGKTDGESSAKIEDYKNKFLDLINDDLNMPRALALMWQVVKTKKLTPKEKHKLLLQFDQVFGLGLKKVSESEIPQKIRELVQERESYRKLGQWQKSDQIRQKLKAIGYWVEDTSTGPKIKKL